MTVEKLIEIEYGDKLGLFERDDMKKIAIKFAQYHVRQALQEALDNIPYGSSTDTISYEDVVGILDCYPPKYIK